MKSDKCPCSLTQVEVDHYIQQVEVILDVSRDELLSRMRDTEIANARMVLYRFLHQEVGLSLKQIGRHLRRANSTISKCKQQCYVVAELKRKYDRFCRLVDREVDFSKIKCATSSKRP